MRLRTASSLAVVAALGLTAYRFPTVLESPAPTVAPSFTLSDGRPPEQAESGTESRMITSCAYNSLRVGGEDITPAPLAVVRDGLAARANDALAGKQVVLRNFTIHVNATAGERDRMRAETGAGGLLNDPENVGCAPDDLRGGYVVEEVDGSPPLITVIDVTIDGREHHGRCIVTSPTKYPPLKRDKPEMHAQWNVAASAQVACALDKLAAQVASETPVPFAPSNKSPELSKREAAANARRENERCLKTTGRPCEKAGAPRSAEPDAGGRDPAE